MATVSDIDEIVQIESESMPNPWGPSDYKEAIESDHAFVYVLTVDDKIIAYTVYYLTPPESELPDIVVAPSHRNKGIGKTLLTKSFEELKSRGVDTVFLEVREQNIAAQRLYTSLGFENIGKRKYFYSNPVEDAICMRLDLSATDVS